jgi:leader peptidase (prepilin peptidase) / N-methyltransferase
MIPYIVVAILGLVLGSFLNVCIYRLPRYESVVTPRSRCPRCHHLIRWYDNVPVVSYLVLRGRCRDCRAPISPVYPLVELLTAGMLMAGLERYGATPEFGRYAVLGMLLIVLTFTDLFTRKIPHAVTLFGMAVGLLLSFVVPVDDRLLDALLARFDIYPGMMTSSVLGAISGAVFGGGLFYVVAEVFARLRHKQGLGFGDVMLMGMMGTFLGVPLTYLTVLLGSLLGSAIAVGLYAVSARFRRDYRWPYGTFLAAAGLYASWGGSALIDAYLHWSRF